MNPIKLAVGAAILIPETMLCGAAITAAAVETAFYVVADVARKGKLKARKGEKFLAKKRQELTAITKTKKCQIKTKRKCRRAKATNHPALTVAPVTV